jgi:hypothetical protein
MSVLADGREAYAERRWPDAIGHYTAAEQDTELPAGDLERLAVSVFLTGRGPDGVDILARAHLRYLSDGDYPAAVRCAAWTGLNLILLGEPARSRGRAVRGGTPGTGMGGAARHPLFRLPPALSRRQGPAPA